MQLSRSRKLNIIERTAEQQIGHPDMNRCDLSTDFPIVAVNTIIQTRNYIKYTMLYIIKTIK